MDDEKYFVANLENMTNIKKKILNRLNWIGVARLPATPS